MVKIFENDLKQTTDTVKKYVDGDESPTGFCVAGSPRHETWKISCGENTVDWLISKNSKVGSVF